jgi:ribosome-associated toxin RatA of RatAB toxin-antitoxin module
MILSMCALLTQNAAAKELKDYLKPIEQTGGWYFTESAIVSGSDIKGGVVYAVIDGSYEHLVHILRDYTRYCELIPFISTSTLIKRHPEGGAQLRLKARILKGAIKLRATVKAEELSEAEHRTTFRLRKHKGNLKRLDATFTVESLNPTRSLVRIELMLDPDVWYVSDGTLSDYNQVNARRIARALKKAVQERPAPPQTSTNKAPNPPTPVTNTTPDAVPNSQPSEKVTP